jgi:gluconolactonase
MGGKGRVARVLVAGAAAAVVHAPPAWAVPDCPTLPQQRVVATDQGRLESIVGDARGRLYYTDLTNDRLLRLDGPGQEPKVLATGMARPGGFAFEPDGSMSVGFSGGALSGVRGNGMAGIFRVDPENGEKKVFVQGIDQANGLARGPDGSLYTSNNIAGEIVRVKPDGGVERAWAEIDSPNGLAIDAQSRYLYAAQTFTPAKVSRIDLRTRQAEVFFSASPNDSAAGLDGLARDGADRLYAAANGAGEVWRIDAEGACALARGLSMASNVAFGGGPPGFERSNLYVVTFGGRVVELVNATDRPPPPPLGAPGGGSERPRLRMAVSPRRVRAGRSSSLRFTVTSDGRPVGGAIVKAAGRRPVTAEDGRARLVYRFHRARLVRVRAVRPGYRPASSTIRVLPRR